VDWVLLVLVLLVAVRGWVRGILAQLFSVIGLLAGIVVATWVAQSVGEQWHQARPALVFGILRVLVALLAGLAVASLFGVIGERTRDAVRGGPVGWIDGPVGALLGVSTGAVTGALMLLVAMSVPWPPAVPDAALRARSAVPAMSAGSSACRWVERWLPGGAWLGARFAAAERRARHQASSTARAAR